MLTISGVFIVTWSEVCSGSMPGAEAVTFNLLLHNLLVREHDAHAIQCRLDTAL